MNNRVYSLDLIKFLMALCVAILHFDYTIVPQGYLCVENFFILSGIMIFINNSIYKNQNFLDILLKRVKSFYVFFVFVFIIQIIINKMPNSVDIVLSALFKCFEIKSSVF